MSHADDAVPDYGQEDQLWLVRHGETEWSKNGRHTSTTDLPLTEVGEAAAVKLAPELDGVDFEQVLTSPRQRAVRTAELAGFPDAEVDADLAEWVYGEYEGLTTVEIRETVPGWTMGRPSCSPTGTRFVHWLCAGWGSASQKVSALRWIPRPSRCWVSIVVLRSFETGTYGPPVSLDP